MKRNSKSVLNGKGFYIALTLSIAMVGAACYFAYTQTSDDITGELDSGFGVASITENEQDVAHIQTDVTKHAKTTTALTEVQTETIFTETLTEAPATEDAVAIEEEVQDTVKPQTFTLSMPIDGGEVLNEFSNGNLVKSNTTGAWQTHNGIDIKATVGDTVMSAGAGTVSAVDNDPLWGVTVSIDHGNGILTRYSNLNSDVTVQAGQEISAGEEIGAVGETADIESKEETHLHFEITKNGSYVNPMELMN